MSPRARARRRSVAAVLALVLAADAAACSRRAPQPTPSPSTTPVANEAAVAAAMDGSLRAIEEGERDAPRDTWDPAAVVERVGKDPEGLRDWVNDHTSWIPYRGTLRGPAGVLMDRQGNALDRALLLAALLQGAGETVRLVRGPLTRGQALDVLPALLSARRAAAVPAEWTPLGDGGEARAIAARYQLDADGLSRSVDAQAATMARVLDDLAARVDDQGRRLAADLPRPAARVEWGQRYESALAALQDHWWVERQDGAGWTALDLLTPDGAPLAVRRDAFDAAALPPDVRHEVTVRVIAERRAGDALVTQTVIEHTLRPAEQIGRPIVLQLWPVDWPADFEPAKADPEGSLRAMALQQRRWSAALFVGRDVAAQAVIKDSGAAGPRPASGGALGALGGGLARSLGGDAPDDGRTTLTAAWIEYEMHVPGAAPRTIRREVFDIVGPAARRARAPFTLDTERRLTRALALTMRTEIVLAACDLSPEFVAHRMAEGLLANRGLLRAAAGGPLDRGSAAFAELLEKAEPTISPLHALSLARFGWSGFAAGVFVDRPGVFTRHVSLGRVSVHIVRRDATDIVANEVGVDLLEGDGFEARLRQGVLDTNAEALLHAESPVRNTGQAYAAARGWMALTPADAARLSLPGLSDDVRERVRADLEAGFAVVMPRGAEGASTGWWRVDPATGDTLGVDAIGWGAAAAERSILTEFATNAFAEFLFCSAMHEFVAEARDGGMSIVEAIAEDRDWRPSISGRSVTVCAIQGVMVGALATLPLLILRLHWRFLRFGPWRGPKFLPQIGGPKGPRTVIKPRGGGNPDPHAPTEPGTRVIRPGGGGPDADPHAPTQNGPIRPRGGKAGDPHAPTEPDVSRPREPRLPPEEGPPKPPTREELRRMAEEMAAAEQSSFDATQRYVRYRANKPNPGRGHAGDPANWDPQVDEALRQDMLAKNQERIDTRRRWEIANDVFERVGVPPWSNPPSGSGSGPGPGQGPGPGPGPGPGNSGGTGPAQQIVMGTTGAAQVVRRP